MSAINKLQRVSELSASDLVPLLSQSFGDDAAVTLANLLAWVKSQTGAAGELSTQRAAPNATGFSVTVSPAESGADVWLLLTPAAGYAAGTVVLPPVAECQDGQELQVTSTQAVTALTVSGNGATVNGAPTALTANAFFKLRFDQVLQAWFRIG